MTTTLIHCWSTGRGYFDFVSSTLRLAALFPDFKVTWAIPASRGITNVLAKPNAELFRSPDVSFFGTVRRSHKENECGFAEFKDKITGFIEAGHEQIFVDFRHGSNGGVSDYFREMLAFKPELADRVQREIIAPLGNYEVLHCRTGDGELRQEGQHITLPKWVDAIRQYAEQAQFPVILVTDSTTLKSECEGIIPTTPSLPFHSGVVTENTSDFEGWATDIMVIMGAKKCTAFVSRKYHPWKSTAFSRIPSAFASIPFTASVIDEEVHMVHANEITSTVIHGIGHARKAGYPTANMPRCAQLRCGVYTSLTTIDGRIYGSTTIIRWNKTETHIHGFSGDLYGQTITVKLLQFLLPPRQPGQCWVAHLKEAVVASKERLGDLMTQ
jgi:hypothetical protein